jgi:hypothetical protein
MDYATENPPAQFKTQVSRGSEQIYVGGDDPERIVGEVRIARGWNAIGRKVGVVHIYIAFPFLIESPRE